MGVNISFISSEFKRLDFNHNYEAYTCRVWVTNLVKLTHRQQKPQNNAILAQDITFLWRFINQKGFEVAKPYGRKYKLCFNKNSTPGFQIFAEITHTVATPELSKVEEENHDVGKFSPRNDIVFVAMRQRMTHSKMGVC